MAKQGWGRLEIREALLDPRNLGGEWLRECRDPELVLQRLFESVDWNQLPHLPMSERQRRILVVLQVNGPMSQNAIIAAVGHANSGHVRKDLQEMASAGIVEKTPVPHGKVTWYTVELLVPDHEAEERAREIRLRIARVIGRRKAREQANVHKAYGKGGGVSSETGESLDEAGRRLTVAPAGAFIPPSLAEMLANGLDAAGRAWLAARQQPVSDHQAPATRALSNRELLDKFDVSACPRGSHGAHGGPSCTWGAGRDKADLSIGLSWLVDDALVAPAPDHQVPAPPGRPWSEAEAEAAYDEFCAWCEVNL